MIDVLKKGKCPFTGKPYDCGRCEAYKTLQRVARLLPSPLTAAPPFRR